MIELIQHWKPDEQSVYVASALMSWADTRTDGIKQEEYNYSLIVQFIEENLRSNADFDVAVLESMPRASQLKMETELAEDEICSQMMTPGTEGWQPDANLRGLAIPG